MEHLLRSVWKRSWEGLNCQGDGLALMHRLLSAYEEPQRKYHKVQHLWECLSLLSRYGNLAAEPAEIGIALWFHDAVYDVTANDNEARSADWAVAELSEAGVTPERIERIKRLILATCHAALPEGKDQMLLVDIDLAILGAPRPRFVEYEAQVREEYSWVPEAVFRQRRTEILTEFLARQPLYHTPQVREVLENQARENLVYSLERLQGGDFGVIPGQAPKAPA